MQRVIYTKASDDEAKRLDAFMVLCFQTSTIWGKIQTTESDLSRQVMSVAFSAAFDELLSESKEINKMIDDLTARAIQENAKESV